CRLFVATGSQYTYSKRRWHLPQPHQGQCRSQPPGLDGAHGREALLQSSPSRPSDDTWRAAVEERFRLSTSPAIGLVGMQENAFLIDFFGCVGFLPLTTHRYRLELCTLHASVSHVFEVIEAACTWRGVGVSLWY
ncbi:unnamed protein product, partial [Ectocarpus sp. 8 AP-2014]